MSNDSTIRNTRSRISLSACDAQTGQNSGHHRACVIGCRMGSVHAQSLAALPEYELAAVCDLNEETARAVALQTGAGQVYSDYTKMLAEIRPDVVAVATPTDSHTKLTLQAVESGAKGVYCEKPMATCLADGRTMVAACRQKGVALAINHQRRMSAVCRAMRRLIEEGAIGEVYLIRGTCAGDILSDGTHTIDTILHLANDAEVKWVFGQVYRDKPDAAAEKSMGFNASGGWRYGHLIETGAMATFEFETGLRAEMLTGEMCFPGRTYQDIEVFGEKGRLWRPGDQGDPPLLIQDEQGGGWRAVPLDEPHGNIASGVIADSYRAFARAICEGAFHPLCGENALRGLEVVMAIYESARLRTKIELPLQQDRLPLEIMVEERQM